jgi:hypothetical protein
MSREDILKMMSNSREVLETCLRVETDDEETMAIVNELREHALATLNSAMAVLAIWKKKKNSASFLSQAEKEKEGKES